MIMMTMMIIIIIIIIIMSVIGPREEIKLGSLSKHLQNMID